MRKILLCMALCPLFLPSTFAAAPTPTSDEPTIEQPTQEKVINSQAPFVSQQDPLKKSVIDLDFIRTLHSKNGHVPMFFGPNVAVELLNTPDQKNIHLTISFVVSALKDILNMNKYPETFSENDGSGNYRQKSIINLSPWNTNVSKTQVSTQDFQFLVDNYDNISTDTVIIAYMIIDETDTPKLGFPPELMKKLEKQVSEQKAAAKAAKKQAKEAREALEKNKTILSTLDAGVKLLVAASDLSAIQNVFTQTQIHISSTDVEAIQKELQRLANLPSRQKRTLPTQLPALKELISKAINASIENINKENKELEAKIPQEKPEAK